MPTTYLDFEKPVADLESKLIELKKLAETTQVDVSESVARLESSITQLRVDTAKNLTRWQRVQLSRHPDRPYTLDYIELMFEEYNKPRSVYYVVESDGRIVGGAGVAPLANEAEIYCELQKMYFLPETRGKGIGSQMMEQCLQSARDFGFEKCYLETMPFMLDAQKLYKKVGFENICSPMGSTGHTSCPVWMLKDLTV